MRLQHLAIVGQNVAARGYDFLVLLDKAVVHLFPEVLLHRHDVDGPS